MAQRQAEYVHQTQRNSLLKLDLSGKQAVDAGMICEGKQEILIEHIPASLENTELFSTLLASWDACQASTLHTAFTQTPQDVCVLTRTLNPGSLPNSVPISLQEEAQEIAQKSHLPAIARDDMFTMLIEPVRPPGTLCIAGAGHMNAKYIGMIGSRKKEMPFTLLYATREWPQAIWTKYIAQKVPS